MFERVLDLGCGASPYRAYFGGAVGHCVRLDLLGEHRPTVLGRAEALPFANGSFDAVLSTQVLAFVDSPEQVGLEIGRVTRPGGRLWLSDAAAWPYDSSRPEHRFGAADLVRLLPGFTVDELIPQGGMLGMPFSLFNVGVREAVLALERRLGAPARVMRGPAAVLYFLSNVAGRTLESLARRGPLREFLGYLHRRMPMSFLVVARKRT